MPDLADTRGLSVHQNKHRVHGNWSGGARGWETSKETDVTKTSGYYQLHYECLKS